MSTERFRRFPKYAALPLLAATALAGCGAESASSDRPGVLYGQVVTQGESTVIAVCENKQPPDATDPKEKIPIKSQAKLNAVIKAGTLAATGYWNRSDGKPGGECGLVPSAAQASLPLGTTLAITLDRPT